MWVFGPNDYREQIAECGDGDEHAAMTQANALREWLHFAVWSPGVLDEDLLAYRGKLAVPPQRCSVQVRPLGAVGDNAVRASEAATAAA